MKQFILINRNFALLWYGKIISQIGDKFYAIALAWWILQETNSPGIMGFFLLVSVLPGLILGLFAGAAADRLNRKTVLIVTDLIRAILVLLVVLLSFLKLLFVWHVFVIGAALSLTTAFFDPTIQAVIPQLVDKNDLSRANSMNQMVNGLCTILGPILGSVIISLFGVTPVFLFNGISYLISALLTSFLCMGSSENIGLKENSIFMDIREGLSFLLSNRRLLRIIAIVATVHFFMGGLMVMIPFLANCLSGENVNNLGLLETFLGVGLLFGAILISKRKHTDMKEKTLYTIILMLGFSFLLISGLQFMSIRNTLPHLIIFLLIGSSISGASVYWQSMLQLNTPDIMTGRVFSVSTMAGNASLPIAFGMFGIIMTYVPIKFMMLVNGGSLICLSCILLLYGRRKSDSCLAHKC